MRTAILLLAAAIFGSVLTAASQTSTSGTRPEWIAPPREAARANPLTNDPAIVAGGEKLFQQRCSSCHGADAEGTPDGPSLAGARVQRQSDGALFWKITTGNTHSGMPTFSFLPPLQRWQLVLHVRAQGRSGSGRSVRP